MAFPRSYLVIIILAFSFSSIAQDDSTRGVTIVNEKKTEKSGRSYALIIGISKYQNFPSLNFADKDALAFYDFLRSPAVGLDSANIFVCLNEKAKGGDIWRAVRWLLRNADSTGETAYIYFAGHGDAASAAEAYLLGHDAPNEGDPILYNGNGTCDIYNLKERIKEITRKNVKVVLITDACRTNELPGKESGATWTFAGITESRSGEIQMTSCAGNEQSMEDARWGNGRGVFSYHLVNGLSGLADNDPQDNEITLYELEKYVKANVRNDTRSLTSSKPRQNPVFCCNEFYDQPLFKVNAAYKEKIAKTINSGNEGSTNIATRSGVHLTDSLQRSLYYSFLEAIKQKHFVSPHEFSAVYYIDRLMGLIRDYNTRIELQDHLVAELMNAAQAIINRYTHPPREDTTSALNAAFFNEGAKYLGATLKYLDGNPELRQEVTAKKLFLEATAIAESPTQSDSAHSIYVGISKADSSLLISNTSYTHNTLGMLYNRTWETKKATEHFLTASNLAQRWAYPVLNLANLYSDSYKNDSAIFYYRRAISMNPNYKNAYYNLGVHFYNQKNYDSALHCFRNALGVSESYANAYNYLGITYIQKKQYDSAKVNLQKVILLDPKYEIGYYNLALALYYLGEYDSSIANSQKAVTLSPTYSNAYVNLGLAYSVQKKYDSARMYYRLSVYHNSRQYLAYFNMGFDFADLNQPDSALYYFNKCLKVEEYCPAYREKGYLYQYRDPEIGIYYFKKAIRCSPENEFTYNSIGNIYFDELQYDSAARYYKAALSINPGMLYANYNMGRCYFYQYRMDSAIAYLKKAERMNYSSDYFFYLIGYAYSYIYKDDSAIAYFHKSLELNPNYSYSIYRLAYLYEQKKDYEKALLYYNKHFKAEPLAVTGFNIAVIHAKMKNTAEALKYTELTLQLDQYYYYSFEMEKAFDYLVNNAEFREIINKYKYK